MFQTLDIFRIASGMARHAGARQAIVAANIANADTPGYRARAIAPFAEAHRGAMTTGLRQTRAGHIAPADGGVPARVTTAPGAPSPNGNTVSLELEMLHGVEAEREHRRALTIYKHALGILRTSLGR